jgi:hypothetical protein
MRKKLFVRNVGVLLTEELYKRIVRITDKQEITLSEFIRTAIEKECQNAEKEKHFHVNKN